MKKINKEEYDLLEHSDLFSKTTYLRLHPDVRKSDIDPIYHYLRYGVEEGRNPTKWFDTEYYLTTYPDVKESGMNPFVHYILHGRVEGRACHPRGWGRAWSDDEENWYETVRESGLFDEEYYLETYEEVKRLRRDPLRHYMEIGTQKGYWPNPWFDAEYYLTTYSDVAESGLNPFVHYVLFGRGEGRACHSEGWGRFWSDEEKKWYEIIEGSGLFDRAYYLETYDEVKRLGRDPLRHYMEIGAQKGYWPNAWFDTEFYRSRYLDVEKNGLEPFVHYVLYGRQEGRVCHPEGWGRPWSEEEKKWYEMIRESGLFDGAYYLENYEEVGRLGRDPLMHYLEIGAEKGYRPNAWFDTEYYRTSYPDVGESGMNPFVHYLLYGRQEGRACRFNSEGNVDGILPPLKIVDPETYRANENFLLEVPYFEEPKVSIIIPQYNQENYTLACIESIIKCTEDVAYEIIVMDDNSPRPEAQRIEQNLKNVKFVVNGVNYGFLKNCNKGASFARGEYLLFLNNDTNVQPGWLSSLVALIESSDDIGMVGSRLVYPDGRQQEAGGIIWNDASGWNFGRLDDPTQPEFNYVKEVDYLTGAAMMIRRSLWEEIGGFDERFVPAYYEDTDLAFEVRKRGYRTLYQPQSTVVHFEGISHGTDTSSGIKSYQVSNKEKFYEKWKETLTREHFPNGKNVFLARDRSRKKKHILFVDHYLPHYDCDAGSRAAYQYLKILVESGMQVHFIGDNFYHYPGTKYLEALTSLGIEVLYGERYKEGWKDWLQENGEQLDYAILSRPHIAEKYIDEVKRFTNAKVIYFGHDLHFLREEREYEIKKEIKYLENSREWKEKEIDLIGKSDISYFFSEVEKEEILKIDPNASVDIVPLYIYDHFKEIEFLAETRKDLLFVGGFNHAPNVDAVLWFVEKVFPKLLQKDETLRLYVVGSNPPKKILELADDNVVVTGYVDDERLEDYYRSTRVVVAPLRFGAGVKGKIVEALYYGMPIVTTSIGAEGLVDAPEVMRIVDTPEAFAEEVWSLCKDDDVVTEYSRQALEYCKKHFSVEAAKEKLSFLMEPVGRDA